MLSHYRQTLLSLFANVGLTRQMPRLRTSNLLAVQEVLFAKIVYIEKGIKNIRRDISSKKQALRERNTKEVAARLKQDLESLDQRIEEYEQILFLLRSIGDSLFCIYFTGWPLGNMSLKESAGYISGKSGSRIEKDYLRRLNKAGIAAIMCDLTNSLRYGDVVVGIDGIPIVFEMKTKKDSGDKGRLHRQKAAIDRINEYYSTDHNVDIYGLEERGQIVRFPSHARPHFRWLEVREAITTAYQFGACIREIEPGMHLFAHVDSVVPAEDIEALANDMRIPFIMGLNNQRFANVGYTPFIVSLFEPYHILDFYENKLQLAIQVDLARMIDPFGVDRSQVSFVNSNGIFCVLHGIASGKNSNSMDFIIGQRIFHRATMEFLSYEWLIDELIWQRQQGAEIAGSVPRDHSDE